MSFKDMQLMILGQIYNETYLHDKKLLNINLIKVGEHYLDRDLDY